MVRKIKYAKSKKLTNIKSGIILLCFDQDNEPVFMHAKTKPLKCEVESKVMVEIMNMYNVPRREKRLVEMTDIEKEIFNTRNDDDAGNNMIVCYDLTNPKTKAMVDEINSMRLVASIATSFVMDEKIEIDGQEVDHWTNFGIKKGDWLGLSKYLISEDGLGLSLGELNVIGQQMQSLKLGQKTLGESLLDNEADIDQITKQIEDFENETEGEEDGEEI